MVCLRKVLCTFVCMLAFGMPATAASSIPVRNASVLISGPEIVAANLLADSWSWSGFWKFWKRQLDKTAGVVGVVLLVGAGAVILIISKTRR